MASSNRGYWKIGSSFTKGFLYKNNDIRRQIESSRLNVLGALLCFCRLLINTDFSDCDKLEYRGKENLLQDCYDILHTGTARPLISYTSMISTEYDTPNFAVGQTRPTQLWLAKMRFLVLCTFPEQHTLKMRRTLNYYAVSCWRNLKLKFLLTSFQWHPTVI